MYHSFKRTKGLTPYVRLEAFQQGIRWDFADCVWDEAEGCRYKLQIPWDEDDQQEHEDELERTR